MTRLHLFKSSASTLMAKTTGLSSITGSLSSPSGTLNERGTQAAAHAEQQFAQNPPAVRSLQPSGQFWQACKPTVTAHPRPDANSSPYIAQYSTAHEPGRYKILFPCKVPCYFKGCRTITLASAIVLNRERLAQHHDVRKERSFSIVDCVLHDLR